MEADCLSLSWEELTTASDAARWAQCTPKLIRPAFPAHPTTGRWMGFSCGTRGWPAPHWPSLTRPLQPSTNSSTDADITWQHEHFKKWEKVWIQTENLLLCSKKCISSIRLCVVRMTRYERIFKFGSKSEVWFWIVLKTHQEFKFTEYTTYILYTVRLNCVSLWQERKV